MSKRDIISTTVKREASIQMVEVDSKLVARLVEIQTMYRFNQQGAKNLALELVHDLADVVGILDEDFSETFGPQPSPMPQSSAVAI